MDAWTLLYAWGRHFGPDRLLHGTAHDVLMATPGLGDYFREMGVLAASPDAVGEALASGYDVVVWPGGEKDSMRHWRKRDTAVLGGRTGFVRMALSPRSAASPSSSDLRQVLRLYTTASRTRIIVRRRHRGRTPVSTIAADIRLDDQAAKLVGRRGVHHAVIVVESGDGSRSRTGAAGEADADGTPMRSDAPYHYASVTKLHTAAATMRLVERGVLELDAPVTDYLPSTLTEGLHRTDGVDRTGSISVRNLLAHTSGLPDYFLDTPEGERSFTEMLIEGDFSYSLEDVIDRVRHLTPYFPPQDPSAARQRARYSDTNFQLLGAIIAAVAGQPFEQVVEEQVIDPLGLDDTWFPARPRGVERPSPASMWAEDTLLARPRAMASMAPEGGLVGTAADAIRFLRALLSGSAFDRPDTIDQMLAGWNRFGLPRDRSAIMAPGWPIEYGLGIKRFRVPRLLRAGMRSPLLIGHTGANGAWAFYSPERDLYLAGTVGQTTAAGVPYRFVPKLVRALGTG